MLLTVCDLQRPSGAELWMGWELLVATPHPTSPVCRLLQPHRGGQSSHGDQAQICRARLTWMRLTGPARLLGPPMPKATPACSSLDWRAWGARRAEACTS